ncbi:MAG: glycosyltransferase [Chitinophagaceae bacterium]|nr:glycosyltransferase [Chitinophagaceae bacterium]
MSSPVLISICIPAYKRVEYLQRLLQSIEVQTLRDFEVIVTDDSPDSSVQELCREFAARFPLHYFRNEKAMGTPENWNEAIRRARGTWIKIMHDDDWFEGPDALEQYAQATRKHPSCSFFFAAYQNVEQETGKIEKMFCSKWGLFLLRQSPLNLFKANYVGNPSCTLVKRDIDLFYDAELKWVVDFEYYIRCFQKLQQFQYIDTILISVGINKEQVTKYTFRVASVEIPESYHMIDKMGYGILRNILVYDYYWRLHRNLNMRSEADVQQYYHQPIRPLLKQMIRFQQKMPVALLKIGPVSKLLMGLNYFISLFRRTG